jgi:pantoate--beta-alanine ligase
MRIITRVKEMQAWSEMVRREGERIGFVPTMGALHRGHARLIEMAKKECQKVVVSIFVNPTQFGPGEDFQRYPRTPEEDQALLKALDVDVLFLPEVQEIYPDDPPLTWVEVHELTARYCGAFRPGHFRGVTTVVTKLFHAVKPHRAYFGEKDYQQLRVIERMTRELLLDIEIVPVPTVREESGLALSSRNRYLTPGQLQNASGIYRAFLKVNEIFQRGERDAEKLNEILREELERIPGFRIEYAEIADPETLRPLEKGPIQRGRILCAGYFGNARLIDNFPLERNLS